MTEDRGELDLTLLIEGYKKEIWEWKQKESQWIRDKNQLEGNKRIIEELSTKMMEMAKKIREAEGETSLVKAIGINSPEMKALKARVNRLDDSLANALEINESHQRYNGKLQIRLTEVEEDNKKLSKQIDDQLDRFRKSGAM